MMVCIWFFARVGWEINEVDCVINIELFLYIRVSAGEFGGKGEEGL